MNPILKKALHELVTRTVVSEISTTAGVAGYLTPYAFKGNRKDHPGIKFLVRQGWQKVDEARVQPEFSVNDKVDSMMRMLIAKNAGVSMQDREEIKKELRDSLEKVYQILGITIQPAAK